MNSNSDSKSAQALGAVRGATSGNIRISNSNNNKFFDYVKNHKWQLGVGVLSVATVITLAIVGVKYLSKKNDDPGKGPDPDKDKKDEKDDETNAQELPKSNEFAAANKNAIDGAFNGCEGAANYRAYFDEAVKAVSQGVLDNSVANDELAKEHLNNIKKALAGNLKMENVTCQWNDDAYFLQFRTNGQLYAVGFNLTNCVFLYYDTSWKKVQSIKFTK